MNYKRTPPQPPPVPASPRAGQEPNDLGFTDYGSGHLHREAPQHDKPGLWERLKPHTLIAVIAVAAFMIGGIVGIFIPSPNQSGSLDSCHTAISLGEDLNEELRGGLTLSSEAIEAVRSYDYASLDSINVELDEHIGVIETLTPEYETAKNRCGA